MIKKFEEMNVVVTPVLASIPAVLDVVVACALVFLILSILGVQLFAGRFYFCDGAPELDRQACKRQTASGAQTVWLPPPPPAKNDL